KTRSRLKPKEMQVLLARALDALTGVAGKVLPDEPLMISTLKSMIEQHGGIPAVWEENSRSMGPILLRPDPPPRISPELAKAFDHLCHPVFLTVLVGGIWAYANDPIESRTIRPDPYRLTTEVLAEWESTFKSQMETVRTILNDLSGEA